MPSPARNDGPALDSRLRANLDGVRDRIAAAARAARRAPEDVRLVAVTKSVEPEVALALARLGQTDLGENRLEPFERKVAALHAAGVDARWHYVGHLQRNKARRVARLADVIHAVDTRALLDTLARVADEEGAAPGLYLQVKLADDEAKHGLAPAEVRALVAAASERRQPLLGLMTMAPLPGPGVDPGAARRVFDALAELARDLPAGAFAGGAPRLSMGMSGDLEDAVAAGATDVRIGTALFEGCDEEAA
jgi:hypothetical protein